MATYQQLEAQRDLAAVHERIWRLIHNGALGAPQEG